MRKEPSTRDSGLESAGIALCYIIHIALYYSVGQGDRHVSKASPVLRHRYETVCTGMCVKCVPSQGYIHTPGIGCLLLKTHRALGMVWMLSATVGLGLKEHGSILSHSMK